MRSGRADISFFILKRASLRGGGGREGGVLLGTLFGVPFELPAGANGFSKLPQSGGVGEGVEEDATVERERRGRGRTWLRLQMEEARRSISECSSYSLHCGRYGYKEYQVDV